MGGYLATERKEKAVVGIIAFEVGFVMMKLIRLWEFLRPEQVQIFRKNISDLVGIKKLVTEDDDIIQGLIRSELIWNMIPIIKYVARIGKNNCSDPSLKNFEYTFSDWISNGVDPFGWELEREKMDEEANKMWEFIKGNAGLYCHMKSLLDLELTLKDTTATLDGPNLLELQNKVELKRNEVENLKERSSWNMTFDYVGILLARSVFTIFSCIKSVYGVPELITANAEAKDSDHSTSPSPLIFFSKYQLLDAPPDTLGAAALHYAEIVIKIENIVKERNPDMLFSRLFLYRMLPKNMRAVLKERLLPIYSSTSSVKDIAAEREVELEKLLEWLAPLAHNTKKWHAKSSYKQKPDVSGSHLLLVQTLYFANQHKTEAAIVELIVSLQYRYQVWQEVYKEILRGNHHHSQEVCKEILRGNYPHS